MGDPNTKSTMLRLRAPLAQGIKTLDRSLFSQTFNLAAVAIRDNRNINRYKVALIQEGRGIDRPMTHCLRPHPDGQLAAMGRKCFLLNPAVKLEMPDTWGPTIHEGVKAEELDMIAQKLTLNYDQWTYEEVMQSIFPEDQFDDIPASFNAAGHVIHLNLNAKYLPYKKAIAEVFLDKHDRFRTVINKVDSVGHHSEFRTFDYEVLAGPDDMMVEETENNCIFKFDYSKVYWNSRLGTEHARLVDKFRPGEVVADVMAGIGPFAVPAAKKGVFVWANDLNPESVKYMRDAMVINKVGQYAKTFNENGLTFIHHAADDVADNHAYGYSVLQYPKVSKSKVRSRNQPRPPPTKVHLPPTIAHFVMNLPDSATTFLHGFRGIYAGKGHLFTPATDVKLPMVHVHCFGEKGTENLPSGWPVPTMTEKEVTADILRRVSEQLGGSFKEGDPENEREAEIFLVRDVAPNKRMFCVSFRVPRDVAFASRN